MEVDLTPADVSGLVKYEKGETGAMIDDEEYSSIQITIGQTGRVNDLKDHPYTQKIEQYFNDASGNRYKVSALVRIDFWECYGSFIIFLGCVYTLISLAICAILTAFQYNRQKAFFAMDDYRKTLMNMMAHDLKTPLAAMSGYAQNLKENIQSEKREHYADAICENTEYMNGIIAEVLSLSKLEESGTALNKEKTDLSMLAKECFERLKTLVDEKKEIRFEEGGTYVRKVDKALMTRAMENLMTNAIKYTKDGGCVRIRAVDKPFYHRFVIESSPMEAITVKSQKLWDPFVKGDESRSEKNGSGLGLFIVKNILTKHGLKGKIVVKNDTFQVIIR